MAVWTSRVGWFTGALVVVSIISAVIFKGQLNVMQGQLDEMERTRDVIMASDGADILIGDVMLVDFPGIYVADGKKGIVLISYKNGGKVVGNVIHAYLVFAADKPPLPSVPRYPIWDEVTGHASVINGATVEVEAKIFTTDFALQPKNLVPFDALALIAHGSELLYVYGKIEYRDRFSSYIGTRTRRFCRRYNPDQSKLPGDVGYRLVGCDLPAYEDAANDQ